MSNWLAGWVIGISVGSVLAQILIVLDVPKFRYCVIVITLCAVTGAPIGASV